MGISLTFPTSLNVPVFPAPVLLSLGERKFKVKATNSTPAIIPNPAQRFFIKSRRFILVISFSTQKKNIS